MSEILDPAGTELDQRQLAEQSLAQAKERGVELVGPNGVLNQPTKNVLENALDAAMTQHLDYDRYDPAGRGSGNSHNGMRCKTVFSEISPVGIDVRHTASPSSTNRGGSVDRETRAAMHRQIRTPGAVALPEHRS